MEHSSMQWIRLREGILYAYFRRQEVAKRRCDALGEALP
jgi:hypothetical protein